MQPDSAGRLTLDSSFDVASPSVQTFLLQSLAEFRALPEIVDATETDLERFDHWLRDNSSSSRPRQVTDNCVHGLPLPRHNFTICLAQWFELGADRIGCSGSDWSCGSQFRFQAGSASVVGFLPRFMTSVVVTSEWNYDKIHPLWLLLEEFMTAKTSVAPARAPSPLLIHCVLT